MNGLQLIVLGIVVALGWLGLIVGWRELREMVRSK